MLGFARTALESIVHKRYDDTGDNGGSTSGVPTGLSCGMVSGTRVATSLGWRPVETIVAGDQVLTFDDGMQEVARIHRGYVWTNADDCPEELWPLELPAGAIGNQEEISLLPKQGVIVESDTGEALFDDPFSLIPAAALEGWRGIKRVQPRKRIEVITLHFKKDQVVYANVGALFFCPKVECMTDLAAINTVQTFGHYHTVPLDEAELMIDYLIELETGAEAEMAPAP